MKSRSSFIQRIAIGVVCVIVFSYAVYHISSVFSEDIETYAAGVTTEVTTLNYNGYIFRDETVLTSSNSGVVDYKVADGTKVSEDQTVAVAYSEGKKKQSSVRLLDEQIRILERSLEGSIENDDIVAVKKQNADTYDALIKLLSAGDTGGLSYQAEKLLVGMNRAASIVSDGSSSAVETLDRLYELREEIFSESGSGADCSADKNGYFFSGVDGCEEYFTAAALEELTLDSFAELLEYAEDPEAPEGAYGKLTDSSQWSIVLPINYSDKGHFTVGNTYSALFAENNQASLPIYLEKMISEEGEDVILLVFSCDRQPEGFSFDRCQSVSLTVKTVSGIYVPKSVVAREDGIRGVYILRGSVVYFRHIVIVYEGSDYYLVAEVVHDDAAVTYLAPNDLIILGGQNLFDGRILE